MPRLPSPAGTIALHALYSPSITGTSLVAGATVMGLTFLVPYQVGGGGRAGLITCKGGRHEVVLGLQALNPRALVQQHLHPDYSSPAV